jgi:hypothetical protein
MTAAALIRAGIAKKYADDLELEQLQLAQKIAGIARKSRKSDLSPKGKGGQKNEALDKKGGKKKKVYEDWSDDDEEDEEDDDEDNIPDNAMGAFVMGGVVAGAICAIAGALAAVGGKPLIGLFLLFTGSAILCPSFIEHAKVLEANTKTLQTKKNQMQKNYNEQKNGMRNLSDTTPGPSPAPSGRGARP